jgi:hypothetical protein
MTTPPEDVDALFGAPPPAPATGLPTAAPVIGTSADGRKEQRVKVSWPARVQLPNGRVVDLRVRDLSESGVGLLTDVSIPANTVLNFAMGVPGLHEPTKITPVSGTIKTTYLVLQGRDLCCGGMWVNLPEASRELLNKWIRRLRR